MIKKYIFTIMTSLFVASLIFTQGFYANAASTNDRHEASTVASDSDHTTVSNSTTKQIAASNQAEFVQNRLPQTGVEANHSGLYFSIAGFFLVLAFFTSRSKSNSRYDVSDKQKK
ncbi:LPXTG cell wall anchor domain-containing protein [Rummeliibacillus sp. JY-2-4R]